MILFFVMAMVAAYTNRNLIFEQRIATNSYRANRALEAADAGVEWTVAMLNGGRINANCQPSTTITDNDFRHRYHTDALFDANGKPGGYDTAWAEAPNNQVYPACVNREAVLSCVCPRVGVAVAAMGGVADGQGSAFRIEFFRPGNAVRPGAMEFAARGCASVGEGAGACTSQTNDLPTVDGLSGALTTVGLVRALPILPIAALTAGTSITGAMLSITNADAATGLAVHAGVGAPAPSADVVYRGPAGSSGIAWLPVDTTLNQLRIEANDRWFRKMFGMDPATYQRQPAVRICTNGCTTASLTNILLGYPRNPIWLVGDLDLDLNLAPAGELGTAQNPVMLIVTGRLTISGTAVITGFVHANNIVWAAGAAGARVRGAMVAQDTFAAASLATLDYDRAALDIISLRYGSFVRVPGSWNLIFR